MSNMDIVLLFIDKIDNSISDLDRVNTFTVSEIKEKLKDNNLKLFIVNSELFDKTDLVDGDIEFDNDPISWLDKNSSVEINISDVEDVRDICIMYNINLRY